MDKQHELFPDMTDEDISLLRVEMLWRAAENFEQARLWQDAAQCWAELGKHDHASKLFVQSGNLEAAAHSLLIAGEYIRALELYYLWNKRLLSMDNQVKALLGQAACHLLGVHAASGVRILSISTGQQLYQQARALLREEDGRHPVTAARCWNALGEYGILLTRFDLIQEGYERMLERLVATDMVLEQMSACQAYLVAVRAYDDRLLCQELEERLAALRVAEAEHKTRSRSTRSVVRVEEGKESGHIYEIQGEYLSIGQLPECDIILEDPAISRLHASLVEVGNGDYAIRDEASAMGTIINMDRINPYELRLLHHGDRVQMGQTVLEFLEDYVDREINLFQR